MINGDPVCIDASVAAKWVLAEEDSERALSLLKEAMAIGTRLIAPRHLLSEVTSAVYKQLRYGSIVFEEAVTALAGFSKIRLALLSPPGLPICAVEIAVTAQMRYPYDAFYLALADIIDCEVWTADRRFYDACSPFSERLRLLADYTATA